MLTQIAKMLEPLRNRILNMVARAVLSGDADDSTKIQGVNVIPDARGGAIQIERLQNYGYTSVPLDGAEAVVIFVGGRQDNGFALATDDRRYRPTGLQAGEVCLYDKTGTTVTLKANGDIDIVPSSGTVNVTGTVDATIDVTTNGISLQNHTHDAGTLIDSSTSAPITGITGAPIP